MTPRTPFDTSVRLRTFKVCLFGLARLAEKLAFHPAPADAEETDQRPNGAAFKACLFGYARPAG